MKIIGLTGGIASGKTTVSNFLKSKGFHVIDADQLAKEAVAPNSIGLAKIVAAFGDAVLTNEKILNRQKLANIVFKNPVSLNELNQIVHPIVRNMIETKIQTLREAQQLKCVILDIPLLFEAGYESLCDEIIVVAVTESIQLQRLMERNGYTKEHAEERIRSQWSLSEKMKRTAIVIDNTGTVEQTFEQLEQWLENCIQK